MVFKIKIDMLIILTIFLYTWRVYAKKSNTDNAPLVLKFTDKDTNEITYAYLQAPKTETTRDGITLDHDVWYKSKNSDASSFIIMLSRTHDKDDERKKWVNANLDEMKALKAGYYAKYEHKGEKSPTFPTEEMENEESEENWVNVMDVLDSKVKRHIPAFSKLDTLEKIEEYLKKFSSDEEDDATKYVRQKLQERKSQIKTKWFMICAVALFVVALFFYVGCSASHVEVIPDADDPTNDFPSSTDLILEVKDITIEQSIDKETTQSSLSVEHSNTTVTVSDPTVELKTQSSELSQKSQSELVSSLHFTEEKSSIKSMNSEYESKSIELKTKPKKKETRKFLNSK